MPKRTFVLLLVLAAALGVWLGGSRPSPIETPSPKLLPELPLPKPPPPPENPKKIEKVTLPQAIFPIIIRYTKNGVTVRAAQGTGFLVKGKGTLVATAAHVPNAIVGTTGFSLHAVIGEDSCELQLLWKHKTADIALMRPLCKDGPLFAITPIKIERRMPRVGMLMTLGGYKNPEDGLGWAECERKGNTKECPERVDLITHMLDAPMARVSLLTAVSQLKQFMEAQEKNPQIRYRDMFYERNLVTLLSGDGREKANFHGLSGGALLDQDGNARGVFAESSGNRIVFVPSREFPRRYIPTK